MKIIHTGDNHYSRNKAKDVFASMDVIAQHASSVDLIVDAGDIWDSPVQNTGASGFPEYVERMAGISRIAPIVMVQGTPSHDADGSLDIFEQASDRITVLKMGVPYFLDENSYIQKRSLDLPSIVKDKAIIFGVPEPQQKWLLAQYPDKSLDDAVRAVFLGIAAERQKHTHLPCILVYHGQVRGSRMGGGQTVDHGVSIDDLALVGADYIAMADIHVPQRVGESRGLHAYYCGAWHPTGDWKDADYQFGFNKVDVNLQKPPVMERIEFPHPLLTKVTSADQCTRENLEGKRVWLELTINKGESVDTNAELKALMDKFGAVEGSRVTTKIKAVETVRAGDIKNFVSLWDKFELWAKNSEKTATGRMHDYIDAIDHEAELGGSSLRRGRFWFYKLVLRGAKGIWKNQKKDTVTIDLRSFNDGVVGLLGPNGRGKSTIMNNFHFWPELPNFDNDPLYKHFRLDDSFREVFGMDIDIGMHYRGLIKVNASAKKTEAYLFKAPDGETWVPVGETNGRIKTYEDEVNRIFGSLEMYLRTTFMMQSSTMAHPDLSRATKATKQQIMAELAGIDYFATYKGIASQHVKNIDKQIDMDLVRVYSMESGLSDRGELESKQKELETAIAIQTQKLPVLEAEGKQLAAEVEALGAKAALQESISKQIANLVVKRSNNQEDLKISKSKIEGYTQSLKSKEIFEHEIKVYDELKVSESALQIIIEEKSKSYRDAIATWSEVMAKYDVEFVKIRSKQTEYLGIVSMGESSISIQKKDIQLLENQLAEGFVDSCPACKQPLPAESRVHYEKHIEEIRKNIEAKSNALADFMIEHESNKSELERLETMISQQPVRPAMPPKPEIAEETEIADVRRKITAIDIENIRRCLKNANDAELFIEEQKRNIANLEILIAEDTKAIDELRAQHDPFATISHESKKRELDMKRAEYADAKSMLARSQESIQHVQQQIIDHDDRVAEIATIKSNIEVMKVELADWKLVEFAMSQNGIQALELDAVCPNISNITTILLQEYQEGRYSVRLDTQRMSGSGNQIEDFIIWICDSATGEEQEFETLSGGERVWINKALTDAFAIVKQQNAATQFLTGFADESDGALDMESKLLFYRLVSAGHKSSGRKQTVFVSHDPQIVDVIEQKIMVTEI